MNEAANWIITMGEVGGEALERNSEARPLTILRRQSGRHVRI